LVSKIMAGKYEKRKNNGTNKITFAKKRVSLLRV